VQFKEVQWVDVTPFLLNEQQPVVMFRREKAHDGAKAWAGPSQVGTLGEFWVPTTDLLGGEKVEFWKTTTGEMVRVPMLAYRTTHLALPAVFSLGLQIGMAAVAQLRQYTSDPPLLAQLVVGHQCTDLRPAADAYRCYIGIALQTK
jgi:hypothetical protein